MLATSQKLLHRARSLRRLHNHSQSSDDDSLPQMPVSPVLPVSPTTPSSCFFSSSSSSSSSATPTATAASSSSPMAIPMPMPPTQRPHTGVTAAAAADDHLHYRQVSTCSSHVSRASSSWSSNASTTSSSPSSRLEFDPLRLHPMPCNAPVVRASPQYHHHQPYDAGRSFYYHEDDSFTPIQQQASQQHGFNFGFQPSSSTSSSKRAVRQTIADIRLASSDNYDEFDEGFEAQGGLSAPPPRHHRLRAHQSEANLQHRMRDLQLGGDAADRPVTPPMPGLSMSPTTPTNSEPASPVTPRMQPPATTESERYFKRGDWKRRGIVFSAFDD